MSALRWALLAALVILTAAPAAAQPPAGPPPPSPRPAPPERVRVVVDAPVEEAFLRLDVLGPSGRRVSGPARRDPGDPQALIAPIRPDGEGTYRVTWRALGLDGHAREDRYTFAVGPDAGARLVRPVPRHSDSGPLGVLARLLALAGPIGLAGLVALRAGVVAPAWRAGGVAPPVRAGDPAGFRERSDAALRAAAGGWWRLWWAAAAVAAAGLALTPVVLLRALGEGPGAIGDLLGGTRWGTAWAVQAAALAVAAGAAAALSRRPAARAPAPPAGWALALGAPPALALVAISWSGHAAAGDDPGLDIAIDALHNLATAAWLGGLAALLALLPPALRGLRAADRTRLAAGVVVRFSALALAAVGMLVATGVYRALVELSSLGDLLDTGYGRALLVKLLIFVPLLALGAYNRLVLHPRLERAAIGLDRDDRGAAERLRRSLSAELALAAGLMVAVAVLASLPPPG